MCRVKIVSGDKQGMSSNKLFRAFKCVAELWLNPDKMQGPRNCTNGY